MSSPPIEINTRMTIPRETVTCNSPIQIAAHRWYVLSEVTVIGLDEVNQEQTAMICEKNPDGYTWKALKTDCCDLSDAHVIEQISRQGYLLFEANPRFMVLPWKSDTHVKINNVIATIWRQSVNLTRSPNLSQNEK